MSKPSNWYSMSSDERRRWQQQQDQLEDARYEAEQEQRRARDEIRRKEEHVRSLRIDIDDYQEQLAEAQDHVASLMVEIGQWEAAGNRLLLRLYDLRDVVLKQSADETYAHVLRLIEETWTATGAVILNPTTGDTDDPD